MSESNPLAGLTADEADAHIDRYQAKVNQADENLKAQKAQLKAMKAARKDLDEPVPLDEQGPNVTADAQPAQITVEGGQR